MLTNKSTHLVTVQIQLEARAGDDGRAAGHPRHGGDAGAEGGAHARQCGAFEQHCALLDPQLRPLEMPG